MTLFEYVDLWPKIKLISTQERCLFVCFVYFAIIQSTFIARKSALEKTQLSDVLITDNLF